MALTLTDDERMLVDTIGGFLGDTAPVNALRAQRDNGDALPSPAFWAQMCEMGLPAIALSEAEGGAGADRAGACLIAERIGHVLAASPFVPTVVAIDLLRRIDAANHASLIGDLAAGKTQIAIAIDERARHAPDTIDCTYAPNAVGLKVDGRKRMVAEGGAADLYIVVARGTDGPVLLLVPRNVPGLTVAPVALLDSRDWAELNFDRVVLRADALVASGNAARAIFGEALAFSRTLCAFELLGIAQEAFDRTIAYMGEREQFSVKIGSFQALQHRAARLHIALEMTRSVLMKAARALDAEDDSAADLASLAKLQATRTARAVLDEAVQMHGGIGVTDELDIGLFMKRARTLGDLFGDDAFHRLRLTRTWLPGSRT